MSQLANAESNSIDGNSRRETMAGLAKGLSILEIFGAGASKLTVAEAARGSDTSRAAARRCLLTLAELGYLAHEGHYFTPLPRLRRLAGAGGNHDLLVAFAQPILERLRDRLNESVSLAIRDGRDCWFIARAEAERIVQTGVRTGARLPAHSTAAGRLLLADLSDDQVRAYLSQAGRLARTPRSIVDEEDLMKEIGLARTHGVTFSDEELELGMRALAVAVRVNGQTLAAISMSTLTVRLSLAQLEHDCAPILAGAAAELATTWQAKAG